MSSLPEPSQAVSQRRHLVWGFVAVLLVTLAVRVMLVVQTDVIQRDGIGFLNYARMLTVDPRAAVAGHNQHAGYPALVAGTHTLLAPMLPEGLAGWERAGQVVSVVMGTVATLGVWALGGLAFGWRVAWVGALLLAVGRKWGMLGADVMSDASALAPMVWGVVLGIVAVRARTTRARVLRAGGAGLLAGLAYWVRPEGAGAMVVAAGVYGVWAMLGRWSWKHATQAVLATVLATAAIAIPYVWLIGGVSKKAPGLPPPSAKPYTVVVMPMPWASIDPGLAPIGGGVASTETAGEIAPGGRGGTSGWGGLAQVGGRAAPPVYAPDLTGGLAQVGGRGPSSDRRALGALGGQTSEAMGPLVFTFAVVWVVCVGVHFALPEAWRRPYLPLPGGDGGGGGGGGAGGWGVGVMALVYGVAGLGVHLAKGYLDWRHCMGLAFALTPLAGAGLVGMVDTLAHLASPLRLKSLTVGRFVALQWVWVMPGVLVGAGWMTPGPLHGGREYLREAGRLVRERAGEVGTVAANSAWVLHYAQLPRERSKLLDTSVLNADEALDRLRRMSPRPGTLVLYDRWLDAESLRTLEASDHPKLELVHTLPEHRDEEDDTVRVYQLHWPPPPTP